MGNCIATSSGHKTLRRAALALALGSILARPSHAQAPRPSDCAARLEALQLLGPGTPPRTIGLGISDLLPCRPELAWGQAGLMRRWASVSDSAALKIVFFLWVHID